jgi:hypothetical protein
VHPEFGSCRERWVLRGVSGYAEWTTENVSFPSPKSTSLTNRSSRSTFFSSNVTGLETNAGTPSGRSDPSFVLTFVTLPFGSEKSFRRQSSSLQEYSSVDFSTPRKTLSATYFGELGELLLISEEPIVFPGTYRPRSQVNGQSDHGESTPAEE